jgi:hypothetical protein
LLGCNIVDQRAPIAERVLPLFPIPVLKVVHWRSRDVIDIHRHLLAVTLALDPAFVRDSARVEALLLDAQHDDKARLAFRHGRVARLHVMARVEVVAAVHLVDQVCVSTQVRLNRLAAVG